MKAILSYTEFCASLGYMILKQKRMGTGRESEGEWSERKRKETGRKGKEGEKKETLYFISRLINTQIILKDSLKTKNIS